MNCKISSLLRCCNFLLVLVALLFSIRPGHAQEVTARLAGTVNDTAGALVPEAALTAKNVSTGVVTTATSDPSGNDVFPSLAPGAYTVSVEKQGFATRVITGITLQVAQNATLDLTLNVGQVNQTVTVEATAPLVDSTSASMGTVVNQQSILDLPLNLRRTGALALVVPGTIDTTNRSLSSANENGSGFNDNSYVGSGGRSSSNLILIDGMISRALNNGGFALQPVPEMVKEFKIENNTYDAASGLSSGTTMNLITESGTNAFHGSAWEYLRNRDLDARNFFATDRPEYTRNQYGAAIGGPIRRNKTFFFGSYEGLRLIQGQTVGSIVPTPDQRAGNFSSFLTGQIANLCASSSAAAPASLNFDTGQLFNPPSERLFTCPPNPANPGAGASTVLVGTPIPGNIITKIDPVAQKVLALFPAANRSGFPNYINQTPLRRPDEQFDVRVDEALSDKDRLFGRYLFGNTNQLFPGNFDQFNNNQHFRGQNVVGAWTHIFSPILINDVRIGYQRDNLIVDCQACPRQPGLLASFGLQNLAASAPAYEKYPAFGFSNFSGVGDSGYFPDVVSDRVEKFEDTVTKAAGKQTITFGGDLNFWQTPQVEDPIQLNGTISFSGQFSSLAAEIPGVSAISDLADLELGYPSSGFFTKNAFVSQLHGGGWFSLFAQDNIRLNSRLSLELGLRWEYRKQPYDLQNKLATLYPLAYNATPGDALLVTPLPAAANDALCSNPLFINPEGTCLIMSSAMKTQVGLTGNKLRELSYGPGHGSFDPRLGISWRPTNSDKLIIHTGAGIFNDLPITNLIGSYVNNNPVFTQTPTYNTAFGSPPPLTNGVPTTTQLMFANAPLAPLSQITHSSCPRPSITHRRCTSGVSVYKHSWHRTGRRRWRMSAIEAFTLTMPISGAISQCPEWAIYSLAGRGLISTRCSTTPSTASQTTMPLRRKSRKDSLAVSRLCSPTPMARFLTATGATQILSTPPRTTTTRERITACRITILSTGS
jgi:Carboxypeptidase regulatory-like domain/TonB dependent receptor